MTPHLRWECGDRTEPTLVLSQLDRLDRGLPREDLGGPAGWWLLVAALSAGGWGVERIAAHTRTTPYTVARVLARVQHVELAS